MHVVQPICCGMDGQAALWTACLRRVNDDGQINTEGRDFGTTYDQLLALRACLDEHGSPIAVLESTEVYWKPTPQLFRPSRPEGLAPANPCVLSLTRPALPVQTALSRTAPSCAPLRRAAAAGWGRRHCARAAAASEERWGAPAGGLVGALA
jgi:hypothetical protein